MFSKERTGLDVGHRERSKTGAVRLNASFPLPDYPHYIGLEAAPFDKAVKTSGAPAQR